MKCEKCNNALCSCAECFRPVDPPFGSLNAQHPMLLCATCYGDLVRHVWAWAGKRLPDGAIY